MRYPANVVLIAGPPCSGKTTLASHLASSPLDVVFDFDDIARRLGSPVDWMHPEPWRNGAEAELRAHLDHLPGNELGTAYVIRSAAPARSRAIAAKSIRAHTTLVLTTPAEECHHRATRDGRPAKTHDQIDAWFRSYSPWSGDTPHGGRS